MECRVIVGFIHGLLQNSSDILSQSLLTERNKKLYNITRLKQKYDSAQGGGNMKRREVLIHLYRDIIREWDREPRNPKDALVAFEFSKAIVEASRLYKIPLLSFYQ